MKKMKSKQVICSTRKVETDCLQHPAEEIRALSTISQQLTEAFRKNSAPAPTTGPAPVGPVPNYLSDFTQVFTKESFDALPKLQLWDHAIKLVPGEKPSGCKVYPLSPLEQKELDAFLKDNLES
jgi:hypothetical protein